MNVSDFHTAVSHNLPLTVFVFNDNAVGQERHDLIHKGLPPKYAEVASPDFEKLAVAFGVDGDGYGALLAAVGHSRHFWTSGPHW